MLRRLFAGLSLLLGAMLLLMLPILAGARQAEPQDWIIIRNAEDEIYSYAPDGLHSIYLFQAASPYSTMRITDQGWLLVDTKEGLQRIGFYGQNRQVLSSARDIGFNISPDGQWVIFQSYGGEPQGIYRVGINGEGLLQLIDYQGGDSIMRFSPDGQWIIFQSYGEDIYRVGIDGEGLLNLTEQASRAYFMRFSPDGQWIIFGTALEGHQDIYRVGIDGEGLVNLTYYLNDNHYHIQIKAFSPDGQEMIFMTYEDDEMILYQVGLDGQGLRKLADNMSHASLLFAWLSRDSQWLIFESYQDRQQDIYRVGIDGEGLLRLTNDPQTDLFMGLSADSQWVFFWRNRDGEGDIYRIGIDGENLLNLGPYPADEFVRLSPDGRWVIFTRYPGPESGIYRVGIDGEGLLQLTNQSGFDSFRGFSRDSQWVYFCGEYRDFYRIDINGENLQKIADSCHDILEHVPAPNMPFRPPLIGGGGLALLILGGWGLRRKVA